MKIYVVMYMESWESQDCVKAFTSLRKARAMCRELTQHIPSRRRGGFGGGGYCYYIEEIYLEQ